MDFVTASKSLPPGQLNALNHILDLWSSDNNWEGQIMVSNLRNEQSLELGGWRVLFDEIVAIYGRVSPSNVKEWRAFQEELAQVCRHRLRLRGGAIKCQSPQLVGVAMPKNRFENFLLEHCPQRFRNRASLDAFYRNCRRQTSPVQLPIDLRQALVEAAEQLLWMTWDDKSEGKNSPFLFAYHEGDEHPQKVRTGLGMGNPAYTKKGLVTLVFEQSASSLFNVQPHCPTFGDAEISIFFFPGRSKQGYGMSNPLMSGKVVIDGKTYEVKSRPEAVQYSRNYPLGFLYNLTEHRY